MPRQTPLTDDDVEMLLHELLRQLSEARFTIGTETERGGELLRIATAGHLAALMKMEAPTSRTEP